MSSSKYTPLPERYSTPNSPLSLYLPPYQTDPLSSSSSSFIPDIDDIDTDIDDIDTDIEQDAPYRPRSNHRRRRPDPLPAFDSDPRFKMETPSPITRAALLVFVCFLFWLAFNLRKGVWMATGVGMEKQDMETVDLSY